MPDGTKLHSGLFTNTTIPWSHRMYQHRLHLFTLSKTTRHTPWVEGVSGCDVQPFPHNLAHPL